MVLFHYFYPCISESIKYSFFRVIHSSPIEQPNDKIFGLPIIKFLTSLKISGYLLYKV